MVDYYNEVAKDAARMGMRLKAWRYNRKALKEFCRAGGIVIDV